MDGCAHSGEQCCDSPATLAETVVATDVPAETVADVADGSLSMLTMVRLKDYRRAI